MCCAIRHRSLCTLPALLGQAGLGVARRRGSSAACQLPPLAQPRMGVVTRTTHMLLRSRATGQHGRNRSPLKHTCGTCARMRGLFDEDKWAFFGAQPPARTAAAPLRVCGHLCHDCPGAVMCALVLLCCMRGARPPACRTSVSCLSRPQGFVPAAPPMLCRC